MTLEKKFSKDFLDNYMKDITLEFEIDAIGLWQIKDEQERLKLNDEEMNEFLFKLIVYMISIGAKPVIMSSGKYLWNIQTKYGNTTEEIANNIVKEWREKQNTKDTIDDVGGLWFATENVYSKEIE